MATASSWAQVEISKITAGQGGNTESWVTSRDESTDTAHG